MKLDIDALAPEERRILLVATDETYARLTTRIDWAAIAKRAAFGVLSAASPPILLLPFVSALLGERLAKNGYLAPTFTRALAEVAKLRSWPTRPSEIPLPHLSPREAARRFRFDHDMPIDGAAYALNPVRADHYVQPALLNERLAREKLAAFVSIAASLGAAEVAVTSGEALDVEGGAKSSLADLAGALGLSARFRASGEIERAIVARFDRPARAPYVPDDLRGWLAIEPAIESLSRGRLEHRLAEQSCTLAFREQVAIGADACASLEGKGINVGGRYRELGASRFSFHVRFW